MGRNSCPAQSHCLRSSVAEPAIIIIIIDMQNHHHQHHHQHPSHAQTHPPPPSSPPSPTLPSLVCLRKDVSQGERFERGSGRDRKLRIPVSGVDGDYDKDAGKPDSDLPDVFEECLSCPPPKRSIDTDSVSGTAHHHHQQQQQQQLLQQQQRCEDGNSVENVPSVPDIVIQYAATPPVANQRPVPATSRTALRHSDSSDPVGGLFAKKGRTHSDSAIYESELKKQCLLGSCGGGGGGGQRSLSCAPSGGHLACDVSGVGPLVACDTEAEIAAAAASEFTGDGDDDDGGGGRVTSAYFGQKKKEEKEKKKKKSQFLKPISWNSCRLDQFTLAEERSPKLYWLRRHSDSTVSNDDNKDVPEAEAEAEAEERCTWRPQSIGGEIEPEAVKCGTPVGSEDPDKVLHWCAEVPTEGGCTLDERRKCLKVKKYLQTRYQNQMIVDTDDVFVDVATDYRLEQQQQQQQQVLQNWPVAEEASKSLSRRELTDSPSGGGGGAGGGDDDGGIAEVMTPGSISKSPDRQHGFLLSNDTAAEGDSSRNAACRRFPRRTGDDDVRRFQNDVTAAPVTSLLPPPTPTTRQTIFDFSFAAAAYSVLGDMSADCSGANGVVFGLLPQNCFPTTTTTTMTSAFVSSPLSADNIRNSFSLLNSSSSSSSSSVPVSAVSADLVSDSKRWQFGLVVGGGDGGGGGDCARRRRSRIKKRTDHSSDGPPDCSSPSPHSPHSPSSGQRQSASNNSTDGATCSVTKNADALPSSSSSSSVTVVVSSQLLACPSPTSSSSSPSAAVTPTSKSCPRVVFDYQFSERINEQRQARGDGAGGGGGSFVCPVCASVQPSYSSLANHVVSHLPSEVIAPPDGSGGGGGGGGGDSSKVHLCRVCNRSFSRSDMLSRHMRLHTGLRPYECHLCQQVFSRSDHLHTHLRTHTGEKPYRCSHCLYAASRRDMVTRHMRIHVRGGGKRGRRSSSTSSLASEAGQTSGDDNGVFDNNTPAAGRHNHQPARRRPVAPGGGGSGGRASCSLPKQRNWSVASSADYNDAAGGGQECSSFEDRDLLLRMTRTESTTSIDSGVSYLTPRSLVPSLWSPGIDSPDVFSRYPGHFLWPSSSSSTGADVKHDPDRSGATNASSSRDADFEMQASFQKFQVVSPMEQRFSVDSNELLGDQQREEECV